MNNIIFSDSDLCVMENDTEIVIENKLNFKLGLRFALGGIEEINLDARSTFKLQKDSYLTDCILLALKWGKFEKTSLFLDSKERTELDSLIKQGIQFKNDVRKFALNVTDSFANEEYEEMSNKIINEIISSVTKDYANATKIFNNVNDVFHNKE